MNAIMVVAACMCASELDNVVVYPQRTLQHAEHQPSAPGPTAALLSSSSSSSSHAAQPKWNMSGLVGAEYTPWRVGNQLWWHNFTDYADDVAREVKAMKTVFGFTAIRVFLHDMLYTGTYR